MTHTTTRRHFIEIAPLAGLALLAACSPKPEPVVAPAPMPTAAPAPAPAPVSATASAAATPVSTLADTPAAKAPSNPTVLPLVDEKEAQAIALGYVADSARADKVKFKTYAAGNQCSGCALFLGKAGDADGGCTLFQGKKVTAKGWCSAWAKKA